MQAFRKKIKVNKRNKNGFKKEYNMINISTDIIKERSPSNGKLFDFSFYIDSQKSAHRKLDN